jgi:NAD(P)-dependent dehydrogenase (short-subunit alcohol dehydrogenase family)
MATNWKVATFVIVGVACVVGMQMTNYSVHQRQPYYSPSTFNPFIPLTVVYNCLAHVWLFVILRRGNIAEPLPAAPGNQKKKIAIVTGSNTGIGFETARMLVVDYGWEVILACRTKDKAIQAMAAINKDATAAAVAGRGGTSVVLEQPLDLSDFESIRLFSDAVKTQYSDRSIDVLVNNAGRNTSGKSGTLDLMFQSNFLGHFLLTSQLMEKLTKNGGRIINLSSVMHRFSGPKPKSSLDFWRSMALYNPVTPSECYAASKLAAILFTNELNRRYAFKDNGISSMAVSPGSVSSDIWRDFPQVLQFLFGLVYLTPRQGATPVVAAAVQKDWGGASYVQPYWLPKGGDEEPAIPFMEMLGPYVGFRPTTPRLPLDGGIEASNALWKMSEELTGSNFPTA